MPIPVHISRGIPPEMKSNTDIDVGLQQIEQPIEVDTKEEGECTDQDDQEMPPLDDKSMDDDSQTRTFPPDPWNDSAFTLQDRLDQLRWESLEPEPNFEAYGYDRDTYPNRAYLFIPEPTGDEVLRYHHKVLFLSISCRLSNEIW